MKQKIFLHRCIVFHYAPFIPHTKFESPYLNVELKTGDTELRSAGNRKRILQATTGPELVLVLQDFCGKLLERNEAEAWDRLTVRFQELTLR